MSQVGIFDARNSFSALIERAEKGEEITITRNGKPVACLVPAPKRDMEDARKAADGLRALRERSRPGPESLKDLINEGRRY